MGVIRGSDERLSSFVIVEVLVKIGGNRFVFCSVFKHVGNGMTLNVGEGVVFGDSENARSSLC